MTDFEYRVIPAPRRMRKIRGVAGAPDLFAHTLGEAINEQAAQGWEFLRSETMVVEEPRGWFRSGAVAEHTVLVFRAPRRAGAEPEPRMHETERETPEAPEAERPPSLLRRERRDIRLEASSAPAATPLRTGPRLGPARDS